MSEKYTVHIRVKRYVKQYLINNCGHPCDLNLLPDINKDFVQHLSKPLFNRESLPHSTYNDDICTIEIPEWVFKRYGYEITKTGQLDFNMKVERRVKFMMRHYVVTQVSLGFKMIDAIRSFQDKYNFPEDVWSYEAIKKDVYRKTNSEKDDDIQEFLNKMSNKLERQYINNLSQLGTISKKYKHDICQAI
jgi:hypothetical protein